jgi:hypothetical protein
MDTTTPARRTPWRRPKLSAALTVGLLLAALQVFALTLPRTAAQAAVVATSNAVAIASPSGVNGYTLLDANGAVYNFGTQYLGGSPRGATLPFVGMAYTPSGRGYALLDSAGHVYNYGDSAYRGGSPAGATLPFRAIAYKPGTAGYTLLDSAGHVYNYGTDYRGGAPGGATLPFRALVYSPSGAGYALMDSAGHVYAYGDSVYRGGAPAGATLPIVGLAMPAGASAYTEVDSLGHVYNYATQYLGGGPTGASTFVGVVYTPSGKGYALADRLGHVYNYGDSQYRGGFDRVANGAPTGAAPTPSLSDRQLAQKILNSGRVTGDTRYMGQIKAYANGNYSCHINPTILWLINMTVSPSWEGGLGHTVYISSLNRYCTGVLTSSGTGSYHYRNAGGHAVDFAVVDGVKATGTTTSDLRLLRELLTRLPSGSGLGQVNCRVQPNVLTMRAGITQFTDACNHDHVQVPVK